MFKSILNATSGTNNLSPKVFQWPWELVRKSLANHWTPYQIGMGSDRQCFLHQLSEAEKKVFTTQFSSLTTQDTFITSEPLAGILLRVTNPEIRAYLCRQIAEEGIHQLSYEHMIEILSLDDSIYTLYEREPAIKAKFILAGKYAEQIAFGTDEKSFLEGLIFSYLIYEGIWFMAGFLPFLNFTRRGLMTGSGEQISYIVRDESLHVAFGEWLIQRLQEETGIYVHRDDFCQMIDEALRLESMYVHTCMPDIMGYGPKVHMEYAEYLADRRLMNIGHRPIFQRQHPALWISETLEQRKEGNFFERHVSEYQTGTLLSWE